MIIIFMYDKEVLGWNVQKIEFDLVFFFLYMRTVMDQLQKKKLQVICKNYIMLESQSLAHSNIYFETHLSLFRFVSKHLVLS